MGTQEYKNGGESLRIAFGCYDSIFGSIVLASTGEGICHLGFLNPGADDSKELRQMFPKANLEPKMDKHQESTLAFLSSLGHSSAPIKLHLKGTLFQLKVWEALLQIPSGILCSYSEIASRIDNPLAQRAVGSALAANPVAFIIPCHRVLPMTGLVGQYKWGSSRKREMIEWETKNSGNSFIAQ